MLKKHTFTPLFPVPYIHQRQYYVKQQKSTIAKYDLVPSEFCLFVKIAGPRHSTTYRPYLRKWLVLKQEGHDGPLSLTFVMTW